MLFYFFSRFYRNATDNTDSVSLTRTSDNYNTLENNCLISLNIE